MSTGELGGKEPHNISLYRKYYQWIHDYCKEKGMKVSYWIELKIQEEIATDDRNPVEVERRKVTKELESVIDQLKKMHDFENNKKLERSKRIAATLVNTDAAWPRGPYSDLNQDWARIRELAVADYRKGADWAKPEQLGIENALEIDRACDWAADAKKLNRRMKELEKENDALRKAAGEPNSINAESEGSQTEMTSEP
ncbi:MAG: hypothetical protein ABSD49_07910 [Candidatus Bathyarchaeia archaeon]|jgi:hypothetical protein